MQILSKINMFLLGAILCFLPLPAKAGSFSVGSGDLIAQCNTIMRKFADEARASNLLDEAVRVNPTYPCTSGKIGEHFQWLAVRHDPTEQYFITVRAVGTEFQAEDISPVLGAPVAAQSLKLLWSFDDSNLTQGIEVANLNGESSLFPKPNTDGSITHVYSTNAGWGVDISTPIDGKVKLNASASYNWGWEKATRASGSLVLLERKGTGYKSGSLEWKYNSDNPYAKRLCTDNGYCRDFTGQTIFGRAIKTNFHVVYKTPISNAGKIIPVTFTVMKLVGPRGLQSHAEEWTSESKVYKSSILLPGSNPFILQTHEFGNTESAHLKGIINLDTDYLRIRSGDVINAVGNDTTFFGSSGGSVASVGSTKEIRQVTVTTGLYEYKPVIAKLVFTYSNGFVSTHGSTRYLGDPVEHTVAFPGGISQIAVYSSGQYVTGIVFEPNPIAASPGYGDTALPSVKFEFKSGDSFTAYEFAHLFGVEKDGVFLGKKGAFSQEISNLEKVRKVEIVAGPVLNSSVISQLRFTYADSTIKTCGMGAINGGVRYEVDTPNGISSLQFYAGGEEYISGVSINQ